MDGSRHFATYGTMALGTFSKGKEETALAHHSVSAWSSNIKYGTALVSRPVAFCWPMCICRGTMVGTSPRGHPCSIEVAANVDGMLRFGAQDQQVADADASSLYAAEQEAALQEQLLDAEQGWDAAERNVQVPLFPATLEHNIARVLIRSNSYN